MIRVTQKVSRIDHKRCGQKENGGRFFASYFKLTTTVWLLFIPIFIKSSITDIKIT
jgi:hypothetical protein